MLVPKNPSWLRVIFYVRSMPIASMYRRLIFVTLTAILITYLELEYADVFHLDLTTTPFALVGLALSIFLGFRNNTSYDRFWEGRKLWGQLVNTSRSAARQHLELVGLLPERQHEEPVASDEAIREIHRELSYAVAGYVHSLRLHLRGQDDLEELREFFEDDFVDDLQKEHNRPAAILKHLGIRYRALWRDGLIHTMHLPVLEGSLETFMNVQGGCERIKSTPIPFAYTVLLHRIVAVYCFTLPFGLVQTLGVVTPAVVAFVAYAFFGLDSLGDSLEEPFGLDEGDLPLSQLSRMIEVNIRQTLGETDLPPFVEPVGDVLS